MFSNFHFFSFSIICIYQNEAINEDRLGLLRLVFISHLGLNLDAGMSFGTSGLVNTDYCEIYVMESSI